MRIFKTALVFTLFFSCVCSLTAQVIESVAYTPTKSGNYGNITTKSVAVFSGDVNADTITGLGDKFTLDTKGYTPGSIGSARDVYTTVTATPTGEAFVSGMINTVNNTSITNLKASSGTVYGNDVNFTNSSIVINQAGEMEIHDVTMKNPKCNVRWVSLPAYTQNNDYDTTSNPTPQYYSFAYCEAAPGDDDGSTSEPTLHASIENATLLGTCTAGWNGERGGVEYTPANCSINKCCINRGSLYNALKSSFLCTASIVKKCSNSITYGPELENNPQYQTPCQDRPKTLLSFPQPIYGPNWNNKGKCNGIYNRPLAVEIKNEFVSANEFVASNINVVNNNSSCKVKEQMLSYSIHQLYCGIEVAQGAETISAWNSKIKALKHASCQGENLSYSYCSDLYGNTYDDSLSKEAICEGIKTANPAGIDVNDFTCIKKGPNRRGYSAMRVARCNDHTETASNSKTQMCKSNHVHQCGNTSTKRCSSINNSTYYDEVQYRKITCPYKGNATNSIYRCRSFGDLNDICNWQGLSDHSIMNIESDETVYFEQPVSNGELLTCKWE